MDVEPQDAFYDGQIFFYQPPLGSGKPFYAFHSRHPRSRVLTDADDLLATVVAALGDMYLISGQAHLRLQPAVALVAAHTKLRLYTVQCMVGKNAFVPQISVGKGAKGLFRAAVSVT